MLGYHLYSDRYYGNLNYNIMKHVFYLLTLVAILYEFSVLTDTKTYRDAKIKYAKTKFNDMPSNIKAYAVLMFGYIIWTLTGLFTWQWPVFVVILLISIPKKRSILFSKIDAFVTLLILLFLLINQYHLKINLIELIK